MTPRELTIDPALWQGETFADQLKAHFVSDVRPAEAFKAFVTEQQARDPSAKFEGWRRAYDRAGDPVLVAIVTWRDKRSLWRFSLLSWFTVPDSGFRYLVFNASMRRIRFDTGLAMRVEIFGSLAGTARKLGTPE